MRSHRAILLAALFVLGVALAGVGAAQQPQQPPPQQPPAEGGAAAPNQEPEVTPGPDIDQILEGEEEVLSGSGFTYDPGNRRDPFKSLLVEQQAREFRGPRPEGIPGLLIDEIDLTGIWRTGKGFVAQVVASNQKKTFLLKEGDQLYDGDVVSINKKEVVFKQIVQDPTALKPFREVVKSLSPS
jgi:Tfp pilus assembly protein PilP